MVSTLLIFGVGTGVGVGRERGWGRVGCYRSNMMYTLSRYATSWGWGRGVGIGSIPCAFRRLYYSLKHWYGRGESLLDNTLTTVNAPTMPCWMVWTLHAPPEEAEARTLQWARHIISKNLGSKSHSVRSLSGNIWYIYKFIVGPHWRATAVCGSAGDKIGKIQAELGSQHMLKLSGSHTFPYMHDFWVQHAAGQAARDQGQTCRIVPLMATSALRFNIVHRSCMRLVASTQAQLKEMQSLSKEV